ncbi:MFS transporter [Dictyobacter halimunensis]
MKRSFLQMLLSFFGFVLIGLYSGAFGVLLPDMSRYYGVDKSVIGLIFVTSSIGYFISALFSSIVLERLGMRLFLVIGALTFLLGALTLGIKPDFGIVLVTRLFMGLGVAMIEMGLNAYVVAQARHASQLNTLHAFYGAGALFGPLVAAFLLTTAWGWSSVFYLWMLLSIPFLLGVALTFSAEPPRVSGSEAENKETGSAWMAALKLPIVWLLCIFLLLYVGVEVSVGNWTYSFLVEGRHQSVALSSWIVSGYWLGLTLGRFTLSQLARYLRMSDVRLLYICTIIVALCAILIWWLPFDSVAAIGFCIIGYCLGPIYPTTVALTPSLVPGRVVTSAIGFLVSLSIFGTSVFPGIAGILAQYFGIWSLLPYNLALTLLMLLFWWIIFRVKKDKATWQISHQ